MDNLSSELEQLGLTKLESKIYLGPLEKGPSTILNLSRYLKLNRTTVHITVESLVRKGLATELKVGGKRQITEEPPEKLKTIIENDTKTSGVWAMAIFFVKKRKSSRA